MPRKKVDKVVTPKEEKQKVPIVKQLIDSLGSVYTFVSGGEAYIRFMHKDRLVILPLKSKIMYAHVQYAYYQKKGGYASKPSVESAISFLESSTIESGRKDTVHTRIAHNNGCVYVALADDARRVVEIDADGWRIIDDCTMNFVYEGGLLPMPVPTRGGNIYDLLKAMNVSRADLPLLVGWIIGCYMPPAPYPILVINGEQGSGKSGVSRMTRSLVDPNSVPMCSPPDKEEDLWTSAVESWIYGVDNISYLPDWMSDGFCRLSTGAGYKSRKFYEQGVSFTMSAIRPVMINGIGDPGTRSDFLDRSITITCPLILSHQRRQERKKREGDKDGVFDTFDSIYSGVLGLIFDAVSQSMRDNIRLRNVPRMADFALWVASGISATGIDTQEFLDALTNNNRDIHSTVLEQSLVAIMFLRYISRFMRDGTTFKKYTATALLDALRIEAGEEIARNKHFPDNPSSLSRQLIRVAPNLRSVGVHVYRGEREASDGKQIRPIMVELTDKYNDDEIRRITGVSINPNDMTEEE